MISDNMKPILIRLHEDEYTKLEEIANGSGHLSKSAIIGMLIAQYGTTPTKTKAEKQTVQLEKPEKPVKSKKPTSIPIKICDLCSKESNSLSLFEGQTLCISCIKILREAEDMEHPNI